MADAVFRSGKRRSTFREQPISVDRFGNSRAANLPYARGDILRSTEDDFQKLLVAWSLIRERGPGRIYIFTGLEALSR
jgi:hypothetical protein